MIVDCAVYRDGVPPTSCPKTGSDIGAALEVRRASPDDFVWVGLHEPSQDEMNLVALSFGLHPLAVEDAAQAHQRPKLERYDGGLLFMVLKTLWYVERARRCRDRRDRHLRRRRTSS